MIRQHTLRSRGRDHHQVALLLTALVVTMFGLGSPAQASDAVDRARLDRELVEVVSTHELPAAAAAITDRAGLLWSAGVGPGVTADTVFRVGSISKTVTAVGLMRLVEAGRLNLDTPVRDLLGPTLLDNPWYLKHPVRVVHLLEHTAGIEDQHFHDVYNLDHSPEISLDRVLALNPLARRVRWQPGTRVAYSNVGYTILGLIIEYTTERPFEDYLASAVLKPLGMTSSSFRMNDALLVRLAPGHAADGRQMPFQHLYQRPASGLVTTANDLAKLVRFLLCDGQTSRGEWLISKEAVARMARSVSSTSARAGFLEGYGLGIRIGVWRSIPYVGHGGGLPEYSALMAWVPETGRGCVALVNRGSGVRHVFDRVFREVDTDRPPPPPQAEIAEEQLRRWCGTYEYSNPERRLDGLPNLLLGTVEISLDDAGDLEMTELMGDPVRLVPVTTTTFRGDGDPITRYVFGHDADGTAVLMEPLARAEYRRSSALIPVMRRLLVGFAMAVLLTVPLWNLGRAAFWVKQRSWRRRGPLDGMGTSLAGLLAVLALAGSGASLARWSTDPQRAGQVSLEASAFFLLTLLFAVCSVSSLGLAVRGLRIRGPGPVWLYHLLVGAAGSGLAVYLWSWGIIGLRLWAD